MAASSCLLFSFIFFIVSPLPLSWSSSGRSVTFGEYTRSSDQNFSLGAVVDYSSRAGMEEGIAMRIAVEDFCAQASGCITLHLKNSRGNPSRGAHAARNLINNRVRAIVDLGTVREAASIAEIGNRSKVPVLSLASEIPSWVSWKWPFLVKAAHSQHSQMEAIATVIQSWRWRKVNIIYEDDTGSASSTITLPSLFTALQDAGIEVNDLLALPPSSEYYSLSEKLDRLRRGQCRVFIVHTKVKLGVAVFREAKDMGMMDSGQESVWITTADITNYMDTLDPTAISSMQGVLGVRTYFPHGTKKLKDFSSRFKSISQARGSIHKRNVEPGIDALRAYDAVWALALALKNAPVGAPSTGGRETSNKVGTDSTEGQALLDNILSSSFIGLTGQFKFVNGSLEPARTFELVNVVGRAYREIGYWTKGLGFSKGIDENSTYNYSMSILGPILWPGGPWAIPRGWVIPTKGNKLKIGVPFGNAHMEFVYARYESPGANLTVTGFSINVFNAALMQLPYHVECEFHAFNGTYDSLVQRVYSKEVDAVVADTAIVANRYQYAEFSQPYSDSNLQIIIYVQPTTFGRAWLILKPFTSSMWIATIFVNTLCGFTVYVIERMHYKDVFRGSVLNQTIVMLTLTFTTLFSLQGRKLHSNMSRIIMVVWLFVALVITQSYTASLTSFLTVEKLTQVDVTVESLVRDRVQVGCDRNSFVVKHLEGIGFRPSNIRTYSEDDYTRALKSGEIGAAFLESPHARVFLAKNCKGFTTAKQTVEVGGFGFVFPKNSPYLPDISEAVLRIAESGTIRDLENSMLNSYKCASSEADSNQQKIGIESFLGLFGVAIATSVVCLVLFVLHLGSDNSSDVSNDKKKTEC
ncbi:glutamate receptor 2.7-like [Punica granatum]|uniref:Glutamate receptor n=2 Tax=Punica granatum TaxID=22663 RepID=A0A218WLB5_PUNGR|nr:glutamate receptor 2.7-like [Punica granatum]OWM73373.1 hypothetical protein CDL15_Pgr001487 [Punica granatum]PKI42581.1 hypothetical protein CRG98_037026 [Punica granatum]